MNIQDGTTYDLKLFYSFGDPYRIRASYANYYLIERENEEVGTTVFSLIAKSNYLIQEGEFDDIEMIDVENKQSVKG